MQPESCVPVPTWALNQRFTQENMILFDGKNMGKTAAHVGETGIYYRGTGPELNTYFNEPNLSSFTEIPFSSLPDYEQGDVVKLWLQSTTQTMCML